MLKALEILLASDERKDIHIQRLADELVKANDRKDRHIQRLTDELVKANEKGEKANERLYNISKAISIARGSYAHDAHS